jgi:histone acetyltransferase HTATIP
MSDVEAMDTSSNSGSQALTLTVGCKLQVLKTVDQESFWREAEVLASRAGAEGAFEYYVHYTNFNKRLDEWVTLDRMKLDTIKPPKPEKQKQKPPPKRLKKSLSKKDSIKISKDEKKKAVAEEEEEDGIVLGL